MINARGESIAEKPSFRTAYAAAAVLDSGRRIL